MVRGETVDQLNAHCQVQIDPRVLVHMIAHIRQIYAAVRKGKHRANTV